MWDTFSAGGMSTTGMMSQPVAINAKTTYGQDLSLENNYGYGPDFLSTNALVTQQTAQKAAPSPLWLVAAIALILVVAR
jgi:hypothetical protein